LNEMSGLTVNAIAYLCQARLQIGRIQLGALVMGDLRLLLVCSLLKRESLILYRFVFIDLGIM